MDTWVLLPPLLPPVPSALSLSLGPQQKPPVSGMCLHELSQLRWGAHQTNRREKKFAFCNGLVFTSGDTGSILQAKADTDRGRPAQEAVGLLLLLEVSAGMLETGCTAGPLGWSLRTPAPETGGPFVRQVPPPRTEKPPEYTFEAPALCSCCHRHRMDAACHLRGYRSKGHRGRKFQKPHAGRRQSYQVFDKGRQAG